MNRLTYNTTSRSQGSRNELTLEATTLESALKELHNLYPDDCVIVWYCEDDNHTFEVYDDYRE